MIRCQFCHQDYPTGTACCARCGAPLSRPEGPVTSTPELEKQIRSLLEEGSLIEAIKRFREQTGASIREAKDAVEAIEQGRPFAFPGKPDEDSESELTRLLQAGRKLEAIKRFRELTGAGLKEAKDAVEAILQGRPFPLPGKPDQGFERELTELLQAGRKLEAIKRFRELTGAGLKEAKDAVEAIEQGRPSALLGQPDEGFERELTGMLQAGRKIDAIKRFREQTGAGLKEAKEAVERLAAAQGLAASRGTGCLNVLLLAAMLIIELFLA